MKEKIFNESKTRIIEDSVFYKNINNVINTMSDDNYYVAVIKSETLAEIYAYIPDAQIDNNNYLNTIIFTSHVGDYICLVEKINNEYQFTSNNNNIITDSLRENINLIF